MELYLQSLQGVSEVAIIDITDEIRGGGLRSLYGARW